MKRHRRWSILPLALVCGLFVVVSARAQNELFVANTLAQSVSVYSRTADGDIAPIRTISGAATGLNNPWNLAIDLTNNELFVTNPNANSVTVYSSTASGDVAPLRTISGAATGLSSPFGIALDPINDELFVANGLNSSITVYSRSADGNIAPLRTISGAATGMTGVNNPWSLALDPTNNELFAGNAFASSITVYSRTADGNIAPLRTIVGGATGVNGPESLALDLTNNELFVGNAFANSVTAYSRTADGDIAPTRTIIGGATGLNNPIVALDLANDELLALNGLANSITVYSRTADGNIAPTRTIIGGATGLNNPLGITLTTDLIDPCTSDTVAPVVTPPAPLSTPQTICVGGQPGATGTTSAALSAFLAGGTATDNCDPASTLLAPQVGGLDADDNTFFPVGPTTVTFRFQDASGNIGTAASDATVVIFYGDLNEDTLINAGDSVIFSNYLVGNLTQGPPPFTGALGAADLNVDTIVNAVDAVILANYLVGNIACLPN